MASLQSSQRTVLCAMFLIIIYTSYYFGTIHAPSAQTANSLVDFHVSYLPPPLPPPISLPTINVSIPSSVKIPRPRFLNLVPPIVHYVYSLSGHDLGSLPYFQYLAIRSSILSLKPRLILLHHHVSSPPHGPYWDLVASFVTLSPITPPEEIFGHTLKHFAHKADVVRLQVLLQFGGIYVDIDTFALRSFDHAGLLIQETVLAMEASPNWDDSEWQPGGLCNAVIVAKRDAPFLKRWLASYETFDGGVWAGHSVAKPWELALLYPTEVTVLNDRAMFHPLWRDEDIQLVHEHSVPGRSGGGFDFSASGQLAYHAWESLAIRYLEKLSPSIVARGETSFTRMAMAFMGPDDFRIEQEINHGFGIHEQ